MADLLVPFAGDEAEELARKLIERFGSLGRALAADPRQLREAIGGHDAACAAISGARRLVSAAIDEEFVRAAVDGSDPALHRYLRSHLGSEANERLHAIFCDEHRGYIADETVVSGSASRIEVRARPLIERALALGATGFLIAHNHPSGLCQPSREDIDGTRRLDAVAQALELELVDHLIVTRRAVFSMREAGLL